VNTKIPKTGLLLTFAALLFAGITFVFLNDSFGGPRIIPGSRYDLTADFEDTQQIVKKSLVMTRGIQVGEVTDIDIVDGGARLTFAIWGDHAPVFRDATAQLGTRTIFGEPFVDLDAGTTGAGELESGSAVRSVPSVEPDEALETLDEPTRERLAAGTRTLARGFRDPYAAPRVNATVGALNSTLGELRRLTDILRGQEDDLATLVRSGHVALGAIAEKEDSIRRVVGSGKVTLEALAAQRPALEAGLDELDPLLAVAERTLANARPLIVEARPLVHRVDRAVPDLTPALRDLKPVARDLEVVVNRLGPVTRAAVPALETGLPALEQVPAVSDELVPAGQNMVTLSRWLGPRAQAVAGLFANASDATDQGDSTGKWVRFFLINDQRMSVGQKVDDGCAKGVEPENEGQACFNAYPEPGDAADPKPYRKGSYERLKPYRPRGF
jgi:phospholipid/cholesterol/gamma-HCH transport system substrate-binding protein